MNTRPVTRFTRRRRRVLAAVIAVVIVSLAYIRVETGRTDAPSQKIAADTPASKTPATAARPKVPEGFPDLVGGLKATPGVLGVETARTGGGKNVIFAWFKDKAAAIRWYNSDMHRGAQKRFFPDRPAHQPLALVPDDVGPIMAIASITWADSATRAKTTLPVSQIAIELYQPLPGGVFLGGRFAPESLVVKGMLDYTPKRGE